jgi:Holliday junction resolvase RusA-like endonuclease
MTEQYEIPWAAMPKARPVFGKGRVFMPSDYMDWKEAVAESVGYMRPTLHELPVSLEVALLRDRTLITVEPLPNRTASRSGMLTGDVDNYVGGIQDALEGVLWTNDRLIEDVRGYFQ